MSHFETDRTSVRFQSEVCLLRDPIAMAVEIVVFDVLTRLVDKSMAPRRRRGSVDSG
jgi:hypothetical protein